MDPILFAQSATSGGAEFVDKILHPDVLSLLIPIIAIVGGLVVGAIIVIAMQWRKAKQAEFEISLKAQMLEQGKSVEEIERVLNAGHSDRA